MAETDVVGIEEEEDVLNEAAGLEENEDGGEDGSSVIWERKERFDLMKKEEGKWELKEGGGVCVFSAAD